MSSSQVNSNKPLNHKFVDSVSQNQHWFIAAAAITVVAGTVFACTGHELTGPCMVGGTLLLGSIGLWIYAVSKKKKELDEYLQKEFGLNYNQAKDLLNSPEKLNQFVELNHERIGKVLGQEKPNN